MPTPYHAELRSLRMKYKSASTAHESCARAIKEAKQRGEEPSHELLEQLDKALLAVTEARAKLLAAMARVPDW